MKAPIVEIFETVQGEGRTLGTPSTFVRFYGCNLRCQFNGIECDTPYAVYKERDKAISKTVDDVVGSIKQLHPKHIVWTGGEPMLYQKFIREALKKLQGYTSEAETNGTIAIDELTSQLINQFNVSLKLKNSNQVEGYDHKRINHESLQTYPAGKSYFKFVYNGKEDLQQIKEISKQYPYMDVWLMPEGISRDSIIKHSQEVVDLCVQNNWRFSPREHIIIWDYQRGK
jgi:organic radical activating enzyme